LVFKDRVVYSVVVPCRNEEINISGCISSILAQSITPSEVFIIDDNSTDHTTEILRKISQSSSIVQHILLKTPRYKIKGYNISIAINQGLKLSLESNSPNFILRMDSDCKIPSNYVEELISYLRRYPYLGVVGGYSGKYMKNHIPDGARLYRTACLKEIFESLPNKGYPIMYEHDTFILYRLLWLGWNFLSVPLKYEDTRPYRRDLTRWFLTGRFRQATGWYLPYVAQRTIKMMSATPLVIGPLVGFFSYIVNILIDDEAFESDFRYFIRGRQLELMSQGFWGVLRRRVGI